MSIIPVLVKCYAVLDELGILAGAIIRCKYKIYKYLL